ncbi:conserved hypothetical protein [Tenacibaculum sp. 190524A02b]
MSTILSTQKKTSVTTGATEVNCGDAENRTRVQTSSSKAFYILSFDLIVG